MGDASSFTPEFNLKYGGTLTYNSKLVIPEKLLCDYVDMSEPERREFEEAPEVDRVRF
jgi:hypothetical protein